MLEVMLSAWTPPGVRVKFCVKKDEHGGQGGGGVEGEEED